MPKRRASGRGSGDAAGEADVAAPRDGQAPDEVDDANYFCEYAFLYHQMDMLEDNHRTGSYYNAIMHNQSCFAGKVVLDVGAGSGILSIFAAKAGAKTVFAVEATDMAVRARQIVEANGLGDVVTVLQGTVETVHLPCKVDIIVSEWMGYLLLRESMLDSVLVARDRFLKPGGTLYPSHAALYLAPVGPNKNLREKWENWNGEVERWESFAARMSEWYEADYSVMKDQFMIEQRKYYLETACFANLLPKQVVGNGRPILSLDLHTLTVEDLTHPAPQTCSVRIDKAGPVEGFTGYFDTWFRGSKENPVEEEVKLTTAPTSDVHTHWGQQLFGFYPPMQAEVGDVLECEVMVARQKKNHRLLQVATHFKLMRQPASGERALRVAERQGTYYVD